MDETGTREALRERSAAGWIDLVDFEHPSIPEANVTYPAPGSTYVLDTREHRLRLVNHATPITADHGIGTRTWSPAAVDIALLEQTADRPPRAMVRLRNASALIQLLREASIAASAPPFSQSELKVHVKRVLRISPNVVQRAVNGSLLREPSYDFATIEGDLFGEELLNAAQPRYLYTPATTPGLFG